VHIFPGVLHGYMMRGNPAAFSTSTREFSVGRVLAILGALREKSLRKAS
jgi:carboxymethylenebutenolidase